MTELSRILDSEYSYAFDELRKKAMQTSYYKYGSVKENYTQGYINAIESLKLRLSKYIETGNKEFLADIANFAMIEFMYPQHPNAHYTPTDSGVCAVNGMGVNEMRDFDND